MPYTAGMERAQPSATPAVSEAGDAPRALLPAYLAVIGLSMVLFAHAGFAPLLQQALRLSYTELGLLLSAVVAGHAVAQPFTGWLFARLGADRALRCGLGYVTALALLVPWVERYEVLVALRFAQGLGTGALFIFAASYLAVRSSPAANRQRQALYGACTALGPALLFALVAPLTAWLGLPGPWALPVAVLLLADLSLLGVPARAPGPAAAAVGLGTYRRLVRSARVWGLAAAHAGSFGIFVALGSWLTTFLLGVAGGDPSRSAHLTAAILAAGGIARLAGGPAAERWGDRRVIVGALGTGAGALLGLAVATWPPAVLALSVLALWCCSFTFAAVFHLAFQTGRAGDGPVVVALVNTVTLLVGTTLPAVFGWLADHSGGFLAGFLLYALVSAVAASSVTWWRATAGPGKA